MGLTDAQRIEATRTVLGWLRETCGEDVAAQWAWEHTPMPCGHPSDRQLEEALTWASLGREAALPLMRQAHERIAREMDQAMGAARMARQEAP